MRHFRLYRHCAATALRCGSMAFFGRCILTGLCIFGFTASPVRAQSPAYTVVDLGTLGGIKSTGFGVNDLGQVAGSSADGSSFGVNYAFLSAPNGGPIQNLGALPSQYGSNGFAVNASGQVAGVSAYGEDLHAFLSGPNGQTLKDLGTLGGAISSGQAVNHLGEVAGFANVTGNETFHAFLSAPDGGPLKDLGTLSSGKSGGLDNTYGYGVNASGQVVGTAVTNYTDGTPDYSRAFLSGPNGGALTDLGTLSGGTLSGAAGVNAAGQVVGYSNTDGGFIHAFVSGTGGTSLQDLGTLGGSESRANAINTQGQVVGYSLTSNDFAYHAFLMVGGKMVDLNTLVAPGGGLELDQALGISDSGYIVGYGTTAGDQTHAFLLRPDAVPETSTTVSFALLLALGSGGLVVATKRKKLSPTA